jgi:hypothetical protein
MNVAAWIALPMLASAHTSRKTAQTCPLDQTKFEAVLDMSGTSFGKRLDLKPLGPTPAPWRVPVCPRCHLVMYKDDFTEEELKSLSVLVSSKEYSELAVRHPSHFLMARSLEHLGEPAHHVAWAYLQSSWQVESDPAAYKEALELSIHHYTAALQETAGEPSGGDRASMQFLVGEELRLLGRFDDARAHFHAVSGEEGMAKDPFPALVAYEMRLIGLKDRKPHDMRDMNKAMPAGDH